MKIVIVQPNSGKSTTFDDFLPIKSDDSAGCGIRYAQYSHTDTTPTTVNIYEIREVR